MRVSTKGRYALAAVLEIARTASKGEPVAIINIASTLGISKIYLEQVFAQLKKGGVLSAQKGAHGGYQLARSPQRITAWDVLSAVETSLAEKSGKSVEGNAPEIAETIGTLVFDALDNAIETAMQAITIQTLAESVEKLKGEQSFMYYL